MKLSRYVTLGLTAALLLVADASAREPAARWNRSRRNGTEVTHTLWGNGAYTKRIDRTNSTGRNDRNRVVHAGPKYRGTAWRNPETGRAGFAGTGPRGHGAVGRKRADGSAWAARDDGWVKTRAGQDDPWSYFNPDGIAVAGPAAQAESGMPGAGQ